MTRRALGLLGRDYPTLGQVGLVAFPDGGAIALSRGAVPKVYAHVDPNEDAGLLVRMETGAVLAVADGYNGVRASELALEAVERHAPDLLRDEPEGFEQAMRELAAEVGTELRGEGRSRTCLIVAALVGEGGHFASLGDSSLFRASRAKALSPSNDLVLHPRWARLELPAASLWLGRFACDREERVALVSDGITNFAPESKGIAAILADAADDADAARRLVEAAMRGGAGDNVVAVTYTPSAHS
jgi:serine/threonine protein phosphatase PrpC